MKPASRVEVHSLPVEEARAELHGSGVTSDVTYRSPQIVVHGNADSSVHTGRAMPATGCKVWLPQKIGFNLPSFIRGEMAAVWDDDRGETSS